MKVMQILPRMSVGGVERGVWDLAIYFKDTDVSNIVVSGGGSMASDLVQKGIRHYELPVYKKSLLSFFLISKIRKIIENEKVDIVHARSRVPAWIAFFATRGTKAHFVTTAHGAYKGKFLSQPMAWGKFVICPSKYLARHMKEQFGVAEEKIVVINRWVDLERFRFSDYSDRKDSNVIVSVGRISSSKGYEYLLEAFKKLVRINPYLKLKIVGGADKSKAGYLEELKTLVQRYALNYHVQFLGTRKDIEVVLREARMLVAPSVIDESFGRVIVESFAAGVPVIATSVGGFKEIIDDGQNGILVDPGNSGQIANAMIKLLNDVPYAETLAINARKKVEQFFNMGKALEETRQVYQRTLDHTRLMVIKISSLGDIILCLPSLKALKERFPDSKICLLTLKKYALFLYGCPFIDEVITLNDNYKTFKGLLETARILRCRSFDYIVDLQNSKFSHWLSFLSFPRQSFGFSLRWGWLLTHKTAYDRNDSPLESQERVLSFLKTEIKDKKLIFWDYNIEIPFVLPDAGLIGINVSASKRWESKNWPLANLVQLAQLINKNLPSYKVVILGEEYAASAAERIEAALGSQAVNLCGRTSLKDLPSIIGRLKVFITPDTATLHLAQAMGVPTIGVFGPTQASRHIVKSSSLTILQETVDCGPCYDPQCKKKEGKNACMEKISVQKVYSLIKDILQKSQ